MYCIVSKISCVFMFKPLDFHAKKEPVMTPDCYFLIVYWGT